MLDISPDLNSRLRKTLLRCGPFDSDQELKMIFVDSRITPWLNQLPTATNPNNRVDAVIELLHDQYTTDQESALVLLLHSLSDKKDSDDSCYRDLINLASELEDMLEREETQQPLVGTGARTTRRSFRLSLKTRKRLRRYLPFTLYNNLLIYPGPDSEDRCIAHLNSLLKTVLTYRAVSVFADARPYPDQVQGKWVDATLLFADVTGFTKMSEKLSVHGRAGAEEITKIVNDYFTIMVQELHKNGGFVLKFGGDALLGMFVGTLETTARSAVQAALNMQREMARFANITTLAGRIKLQMKVGIHTGPVFAVHVGNDSQMEYWVTGRNVNLTAIATEAAAEAENVFQKGQVVGSTDTTTYLTAWGEFQHPPEDPEAESPITPEMRERFHIIPMTRVFDRLQTHSTPSNDESYQSIAPLIDRLDTLVPYLPNGLLPRLVYNPHSRRVEGEHRLVAVLFINVDGFSKLSAALGTEQTQAITDTMQDYFITIQTIIHRHGGTINKIDLYQEGDKVLAVFGAPKSYEDDADQAARVALKIQATINDVNQRLKERCPEVNVCLRQRIGLSTGFVFSGNVGPDICQEYTIMGDNVNLAARLMSKAGWGEILVSEHAYYWLSPFCDFATEAKSFMLKGIADPVSAYQLIAMKSKPYRPQPRFVDRIKARKILQKQLEKLVRDKDEGQITITRGEPGIGKSRLWARIKEQLAETQEIRCLVGRCRSQEVTYQLFAEMLREYMGLEATDDLGTQRDVLVKEITTLFDAEQVTERAPFLAIVMDLPLLPEWENAVRLLDEQLPARLAKETSEFFKRLAKNKPLLLVCEDLQWLNEYTQPILLKIIELVGSMRVMLGLTLYPGIYPIYEEVANKARNRFSYLLEELSITPMKFNYCKQIVRDVLKRKKVPDDKLKYICERSEGNPLLIVEITRAIYADPTVNISPSAYHMIESRIDSLPEGPIETLKAAAIIGTEFSLDELFYILEIEESNVRDDLSILRSMNLISKQARNYHFVHALTQEVAYDKQAVEKRTGYHRRLAEYWEYEKNAHKAARHYFAAESWEDALRLGKRTADEHLKNYAYPEAIRLYEQSLQAAEKLGNTSALRRLNHQLGEACYFSAQYEKAEQAYKKELGFLFIQSADDLAHAEVHTALGQAYDRWGKYSEALVELDQGLRLAGSAPTITRAQLLRVRCSTLRSIGEHEKAIESGKEAIAVARTVGSHEEEAYANNNLGSVYGEQGQIPSALECHLRALELRRELGDRYGEEQSLNNVALCHIFMGQVAQAEVTFAEALKIQQEIGDRVGEGSTHHSLGRIDSIIKGQYEIAEAKFQQALEIWSRIDYRKGIAFVHHDLGAEVYFKQNRWDKAREHLELAITDYEEMGIKQPLPDAYKALGEVSSKQSFWDEAREHLEIAIKAYEEMDEEMPEKQSLPEAYLAIAPVYRTLGLMSETLTAVQKARDGARENKNSEVEEAANKLLDEMTNTDLSQG